MRRLRPRKGHTHHSHMWCKGQDCHTLTPRPHSGFPGHQARWKSPSLTSPSAKCCTQAHFSLEWWVSSLSTLTLCRGAATPEGPQIDPAILRPFSTVVFAVEKHPCVSGPTPFKPGCSKVNCILLEEQLKTWSCGETVPEAIYERKAIEVFNFS